MTNVSDIAKLVAGESLDADPAETREWLEALDALVAAAGKERARYVMGRLTEHAGALDVQTRARFNTPY
ncbi:MAG TPA: hypothetical protein VGC50_09005, partial [Gammaproteobacteria bacterium]